MCWHGASVGNNKLWTSADFRYKVLFSRLNARFFLPALYSVRPWMPRSSCRSRPGLTTLDTYHVFLCTFPSGRCHLPGFPHVQPAHQVAGRGLCGHRFFASFLKIPNRDSVIASTRVHNWTRWDLTDLNSTLTRSILWTDWYELLVYRRSTNYCLFE